MSRRPVNPSRRVAESDSSPISSSTAHKSRTSSLLPIGLVLLVALVLVAYSYFDTGVFGAGSKVALENEGISCTLEVQKALPFLKKVYGDSMQNVLHVGPDSCSLVFKLLKEEGIEAWGIEPYDLEDADNSCKKLVRKGIVRVADIKFPLPYRPKSFSLVIVSDVLEYLSPKYLNKTVPDLAKVSKNGLVLFAGYPGKHRAKAVDLSKFGRPAKLRSSSWWIRFFVQTRLTENEAAIKKFELATSKKGYNPSCQIFHLTSFSG